MSAKAEKNQGSGSGEDEEIVSLEEWGLERLPHTWQLIGDPDARVNMTTWDPTRPWEQAAGEQVRLLCEGPPMFGTAVHAVVLTSNGWAARVRLIPGDVDFTTRLPAGPTSDKVVRGLVVTEVELRPTGGAEKSGAQMLRSLGFGEVLAQAERFVGSASVRQLFLHDGWPEPPMRRGRRGRSPLEWAQIAAQYVEACDVAPRSPVKHLATALGVNVETARAMVGTVRSKGLLTKVSHPDSPGRNPGQPGGELTDEARRLLAEAAAVERSAREVAQRIEEDG